MHSSSSTFAPFAQVPELLIADKDPAASSLLTDLPFIGLGSIGIAMLLFMAVTRRLTKSNSVLILSVHSAFIGAIMDVGNVIVMADSNSVDQMFPLIIAREVFLAISLGSKFFYVWHLSGQSVPALVFGGNPFPASWARWGLGGTLANGTLLILSAGIGLTQLIWRAGFLFHLSSYLVIYDLDAILEIVTTGLLIAKLVLNIWFSPPFLPSKAAMVYTPVIFTTLLGLAGPIGNLLAFMFSESPYGRIFEAVQLYLYALYAFVVSFYGSISKDKQPSEKAGRRRPSLLTIASFRGGSPPPSLTPPFYYPSPAPLMETYTTEGASFTRPEVKRRSTAEHLSQWVQERVVLSPTTGRSWLDLERQPSMTEQAIQKPSRTTAPTSDRNYYRNARASRQPALASVPERKPSTSSQGAGGSDTVVSPTNGGRVALSQSGSSKQVSPSDVEQARAWLSRDSSLPPALSNVSAARRDIGKKASIVGRPTITRIQSAETVRARTPSTDLSVALREQEERDKTVADIVQPRDSPKSQYAMSPRSNSYRSGASSLSLSNFPSPPPMPAPMPSMPKTVVPRPLRLLARNGAAQQPDKRKPSLGKDESVIIDDVVFTLEPPTSWKRNVDRKVDSYTSATSSAVVVKPDAYDKSAQWDITSFIGGGVSPTADSQYTPTLLSAGPPSRRDVTARYPSAIASSAVLTPVMSASEAESEDTAQILEVKRRQTITRILTTVPDKAKAKERTSDRAGSIGSMENDVSILPQTASSSGSPSREASPRSSPKLGIPGKTSPFPTRPLAGLASLSTQVRSTSPGGTETMMPMSDAWEKPRPAPSPVSTTTSPQLRAAQAPSGYI